MSKSIIQTKKECYYTQSISNLHKHHVFGGAFRDLAEKYGLWIWLRADYHVGTTYAVHNNPKELKKLRILGQIAFEKLYGHEKFMKIFKKNYL